MSDRYQPQEFEKKWIQIWDKEKVYSMGPASAKASAGKEKSYVLAMFPYPSGAGLHVGHVRNYTGTDVVARYFRMNGHSVLHPMGWDAFGLPAENAAVKAKKNPMDMVPEHIATFKKQMKSLGFSYDWDREFTTTDPNYYKWTQWLFIQFYKMGLLYKKNAPINYCPKCKTGLAEEEVLVDGTHERCGNKIEKRDLPQWVFKITKYADRLLSDLEGLDWPKGILEMQRNWIGKKEGININYKIKGSDEVITCFTTRPDTNFGATFIVIAPEHEFVKKIKNEDVKKYVEETASRSE
ncbi:MAG: class I tRNA ligase family protein, partial [Candidatus Roizmanbacteria bacterium]|nr:class I tRNA ligase family protein [Candidatus Roizmanbacteria bacterium]